MPFPDVSFTNNAGTIAFKRCLVDIADDWQWDGRIVVKRKRITVDAHITRDHSEALEGIQTQIGDGPSKGLRGELTLPWTVLSGIKVESVEMEENVWLDMVKVHASFLDDLPTTNLYTLSFFGYGLENPRLSLSVPAKNTYDHYAQIPIAIPKGTSSAIGIANPFYGPIRFRTGYAMMHIVLAGCLMLPEGVLPPTLVDDLTRRMGVGDSHLHDMGHLPAGFPAVFKLGDAIPELAGDLAITSVFVAGGQIAWAVEEQKAQITVQMRTQPQAWEDV